MTVIERADIETGLNTWWPFHAPPEKPDHDGFQHFWDDEFDGGCEVTTDAHEWLCSRPHRFFGAWIIFPNAVDGAEFTLRFPELVAETPTQTLPQMFKRAWA